MIAREPFINLLRELGYRYKDQTEKSQLWRSSGTSHAVWIRRKQDPLSESYVRSTLAQCGLSVDRIEQFIAQYKAQ